MKMRSFMEMAKAVTARGVMGSCTEKDVSVTRGTSRKTIRGYDCTELAARVGKSKIDISYWIFVPGRDIPMENYYSFARKFGTDPALGKINLEMSRDKAYPIEGTVRNVNGVMKVICRELKVLGKGESMPGIPTGYEMTEMP